MNPRLIPSDPNLAEVFHRWRQDEEMRRYNPLAPSTVESLRDRLSKASSDLADYETADSFFWFIQSESSLVGNIGLSSLNRMMQTAELSYAVTHEARGRGLASWAIRQVSENVFAQTPIRKLIAFVHEKNIPSIRALEKARFRQEGLLREHYLIEGVPANELIFGLLKSDRT